MRSHVFSLCPDPHFLHEQFRNCTAQSKNSYFARQSENSHFAQDNSEIVSILTLRRTLLLLLLLNVKIGFSDSVRISKNENQTNFTLLA